MAPANSIYDIILPIYVLSKVLGLAPFTLRRKKLQTQFGLMTILQFIAIIGILSYLIISIERLKYHHGIGEIALKCELYLGTLMTFTVLILAVTNQAPLIKSIDGLARIDMNISSLCMELNFNKHRKFVLIQIIFITCIFAIKTIVQFFAKPGILLMYSCFNIFDYINTIMLFQYVDLLLLIRQRFILLNRRLNGMSRLRFNKDILNVITPILCRKHDQFYSKIEYEFVNIAMIYYELCRVSRLVNKTYSIQILVTISSRFVMITTQLINTYNAVRNPNRGSSIQYILLTTYLALHSLKIFMVASLSENTAAKAKSTGIYLHEIWNVIPKLRNKIEYFSLQILHQDLKFTACGFFVLDYTLIYGIIGAITTYLIIVIQLEKAF